jgi:peptidoglycan/LPS O-acetylase OafA/YrhL
MRWALPFLGVVSGYLFFRTFVPTPAGYAAKLRTRTRTVLVPFLIWSGLGVLFTVAVTHSRFAAESPYWTVHSVGAALDHWLLHPVIYPLWFLQALMTCMVLSPLVYLAVKYLRWWVLLIAAAWWVLGWQPTALWPWVSATAFPPFIVGSAIAILGWKTPFAARGAAADAGGSRRRSPPAWLVAALGAAWLGSAALFATYGHELGRWTRASLLPVVVLGVCTAWVAGDALVRHPGEAIPAETGPARRSLRQSLVAAALFVAPLSFFVYVTQEPALAIVKNLVGRLPEIPPLVAYAATPVVVVVTAVLIALALRRLVPRTFAVIAGGRVPKTVGVTAREAPAPSPSD